MNENTEPNDSVDDMLLKITNNIREAIRSDITLLITKNSGDRFETARSLNQQLTFQQTEAYFHTHNIPFANPQQRSLKVLGDDETYTNLGLLLSDQCPFTIKTAIFDGTTKRIFKHRQEFEGSLFKQMEDCYEFLNRYNRIHARTNGLYRIDTRDYPEEALREALLNSIIHREYGLSASSLISMFDDRLEFLTVGGLKKDISLNDVLLGVSSLRNANLAHIFYRLQLIEAFGTGIQKIFEEYHDCPVKPKIELSDNAFKLTLPNLNFVKETAVLTPSNLTEREQLVMSLFDQHQTITRPDVETVAGISQATAIKLLREMVEKGLLVKVGQGKNLLYRLP